jgi:hypothetical protein
LSEWFEKFSRWDLCDDQKPTALQPFCAVGFFRRPVQFNAAAK